MNFHRASQNDLADIIDNHTGEILLAQTFKPDEGGGGTYIDPEKMTKENAMAYILNEFGPRKIFRAGFTNTGTLAILLNV